jgi:hypothetical protein
MPRKARAEEKPQLPGDIKWPEATKKWYSAWRGSKLTDGWGAEQWHFMFDTAFLHRAVWQGGEIGMMSELRQRMKAMGLVFVGKEERAESEAKPIPRKSNVTTLSAVRAMREKEKAKQARGGR